MDGSGYWAVLRTRKDTPRKACVGPHKGKTRDTRGSPTPHPGPHSYLPHRIGEDVDDLLVRGGHHALPVDLNDPVSHADAASLRYPPSHEAADLSEPKAMLPFTAAPGGGELGGDGPVLPGAPALSSLRSWCVTLGAFKSLGFFSCQTGLCGPCALCTSQGSRPAEF